MRLIVSKLRLAVLKIRRRRLILIVAISVSLIAALNSLMRPADSKMRLDFKIWPEPGDSFSYVDRTANQFRAFDKYLHIYNASVRKAQTKSILLIGSFFFDAGDPQTTLNNEKCPISECTMTLDADQYRQTADAIVFLNMNATYLKRFLPKPAHQIWITNHWESPPNNWMDTSLFGANINWSSSYRHDSHIVLPYGYIEPIPVSSINKNKTRVNHAAGKTKKVAWFASNCNDNNGRLNYTLELSKYINVDIYGKCGKLECSRDKGSQCFELLEKDYKFYVSFENSNCHYYITEKLFINALGHNVVPIVMGARRQDYARTLPPHSYIHVDDFRSPRDLAEYLHDLDSNDALYNEYFQWKSEYTLTGYPFWCRLCGLLHVAAEQRYVHWYTDYSQWWDSVCVSKKTMYNEVSWRTWNV